MINEALNEVSLCLDETRGGEEFNVHQRDYGSLSSILVTPLAVGRIKMIQWVGGRGLI